MAVYTTLIDAVTNLAVTMGNALQLQGFKTGGTAGQVPTKSSGTDFAWSWQTPSTVSVSGNGITITDQTISLSIGTGSTQVAAGDDSRFTNERVPTDAGLTSKFSTEKTTGNLADADRVAILDSAAANIPKHGLLSSIWDYIKVKGDQCYGYSIRSFLTADLAPIISQTTLQNTNCSVALPVGTWRIQAMTVVTNVTASAGINFGGTLTGGSFSERYGKVRISSGSTVTEETKDAAFTTTKLIPTAGKGVIEYDFQLEVTSGTCTVATKYSQASSTATNTTCKVGCYIIATKIA